MSAPRRSGSRRGRASSARGREPAADRELACHQTGPRGTSRRRRRTARAPPRSRGARCRETTRDAHREGARREGLRSGDRRRRPRSRSGRASARRAPQPVVRVEGRARGCLRRPRGGSWTSRAGAPGSARRARAGLRRSRARARSRRNGAARQPARASPPPAISATVTCGIGCAFGPPGRRAGQHQAVDAVGMRDARLLRDHPAEARPDDVRPLDPASSSTWTASAAISATVYGPGGASLPRSRGCRTAARRTARRARGGRAPSPNARVARGSGAPARRRRAFPTRSADHAPPRPAAAPRAASEPMRPGRLARPPRTKTTATRRP